MSDRTPKDFAIEFGEYLAKAAEAYLDAMQAYLSGDDPDYEGYSEAARHLAGAIYEFRKRVPTP